MQKQRLDEKFVQKTEGSSQQQAPRTQASATVGSGAKQTFVEKWIWEAVFLVCAVLFAVNFLYGQQQNRSRAVQFLKLVQPVLAGQFSRVDTMSRTSPHEFRMYCTGRVNCYAAVLTLQLLKRQDLSALALGAFTSTAETCLIEVPMTEKLDQFVFAIFPPLKEKRFREEYVDLNMTKKRGGVDLTNLACFCDSSEGDKILTPHLRAELNACAPLIQCFYVSDSFQLFETEYKQMARFQILFPRKREHLELLPRCIKLISSLIDAFASFRLSFAATQKVKTIRKKAQSEKAKEEREAADAKLEEKKLQKLQEERDHLKTLTGKALEKAQEKIRKREQKQRDKKLKSRSMVVK